MRNPNILVIGHTNAELLRAAEELAAIYPEVKEPDRVFKLHSFHDEIDVLPQPTRRERRAKERKRK